jgi:abortive infection bacteriophage resistance protein
VKPAKTLDEQVALVVERGLDVRDVARAKAFLLNTNYYRLSGYMRQFQRDPAGHDDNFVEGARFDDVARAYEFDVKLSQVLLRDLCVVERSVRARFAYHLAQVHGELAFYLERSSYMDVMPKRDEFVGKLVGELERSRRQTVRRYVVGGDYSNVPVWVAVEEMSFGALSNMLQYLLDDEPARLTAASYSHQWAGFQSTIHSLAVLRNRCAHHGQIWHRRLDKQTPIQRKRLRHEPEFDVQGPYAAIIAVKRLLAQIEGESYNAGKYAAFLGASPELAVGVYFPRPQ